MKEPVAFIENKEPKISVIYLQSLVNCGALGMYQVNVLEAKNGINMVYTPYGVRASKGNEGATFPYGNIRIINEKY